MTSLFKASTEDGWKESCDGPSGWKGQEKQEISKEDQLTTLD